MENQLVKSTATSKQVTTSLPKGELTQRITSSSLTTVEKDIAIASIERWIKDYSVDELTVLMTGLILKTHSNCGQKDDGGLIDMTIDELVSDLQKYNGNISFQEIQIAFNNGYKGVYGEYFGLNNKTYFGWVNAFTWSVQRQNAKKLLKPVEVRKVLTEKDIDRKLRILSLWAFRNFKQTGKYIDAGNVTYNYLFSIGVIPFTKERREEFKGLAIVKLKAEALEAKQSAKGVFAIRDAVKNLEDINSSKSLKVIAEAKRIALNTYFSDLVEMGEELRDKI